MAGALPVYFGYWGYTGAYYSGLMDEIQIYPAALDDATITGIFDAVQPDTFYPTNGCVSRPHPSAHSPQTQQDGVRQRRGVRCGAAGRRVYMHV